MIMIESLINIASVIILCTFIIIQDWKSVIIYISILSLCYYVIKSELYISFGIAGTLACLMHL